MILQSLMQYYESLVEKGKVPRMGWCHAKVSCAIELDEDGQVKAIIPLKVSEMFGKKEVLVPQQMNVPQMVVRSSGISANFLCDNSKYMLGIDSKHSKELGDCPAYKLFDSVEVKKIDGVEYPRRYQDYIVEIHNDNIPDSVEVKRMV